MRGKRFTEEQIVSILKESSAGVKTDELCRRHGICQNTFYRWKAKYSDMEVSDVRRLTGARYPGVEGGPRKKVLTPPQQKEAVETMKAETKISERRAGALVGINRLTYRYQPQIRDDASLRERMRELAKRWKRFGYRRLAELG